MTLCHVNIEAAFTRNLLQLPLGSRGTPEVLQSANDFEHSCQSDTADIHAQTCMRTDSVVNIGFERAIDVDGVRRGEDFWIAIGANLTDVSSGSSTSSKPNCESDDLRSCRRLYRPV